MNPIGRVQQERYAVILAGGDATKLMSLTRRITGRPVPKQFCPVAGESTLLEQTRRRVALEISPKRTLLVLNRRHQAFYGDQIADVPESRLVVQPENRGTAPAILFALLRLAKVNPYAVVTVFPSNHYVDDDGRFMSYADVAMGTATLRSGQLTFQIAPSRDTVGSSQQGHWRTDHSCSGLRGFGNSLPSGLHRSFGGRDAFGTISSWLGPCALFSR